MDSWRQVPDDKKVIYGLIAANVGIFLLWRIPGLERFMLANFVQVHLAGAGFSFQVAVQCGLALSGFKAVGNEC